MNDEQRFAFDTWGYLVVEDALTPDQTERLCATANEHGGDTGTQLSKDGGFWSQDFFDLLDVPVIADLTAHWDIDHLHRWSSNRS